MPKVEAVPDSQHHPSIVPLELTQKSVSSLDNREFTQHLTQWFKQAQRDLPWRRPENARDPYRVLVSEIMLQQTTVAAVVPFYERFLLRFPTLEALAAADVEEVLPLWAGLGYYARARNLHACARAVVERHGGSFPRDLNEVLALPGIGRYTAGAVTSIAFDAPSPIVDANVARVFTRIFCIEGDLKTPANQKLLWSEAEKIIEERAEAALPSQLNPALMELGALICVPREPRCHACPVAEHCCARASGRENELPHATPKPVEVALHDVCAFMHRSTPEGVQVLLRRRPDEDGPQSWWRGMWELPRTTINSGAKESAGDALRRLLQVELCLAPDQNIKTGPCLKTMRHGVTHHRITLDCYVVEESDEVFVADEQAANVRWFYWHELAELALPSTMRRLLQWLEQHIANGQLRLWS